MTGDLPTQASQCRLCGGGTQQIFRKKLLCKYEVNYFRCSACGSQQTEYPHWLDEAYSIPGLHIDVGAASRSVKNWLAATVLLDQMGFARRVFGVDFGSGPGLFTSLMRNSGRDFHSLDPYTRPIFSSYFSMDRFEGLRPDVVTAFEVFEHLPEPATTISSLLNMRAPIVIFTTWPVDDQAEDWIYYLPDCGQHVFFYSTEGLRQIGLKHGYKMTLCQYFYVYYDDSVLSAAQLEKLTDFTYYSIDRVRGATIDVIADVINGNEHIDADLTAAMTRFKSELPTT